MFGIMWELSKSSIRVGKYVFVLPALIPVGCLEKILRLRQGSVGKMAGSKKTGWWYPGKGSGLYLPALIRLNPQ